MLKIKKLNINSFGKLKNEEIQFGDGVNIIYGKNESGKSTIMHYILSSFYGIGKNKKGREFSEFDKYLPWSGEEFSGKLLYELDDGNRFEVYRDFKKKNPKIYNEQKEDISNQFTIDKSTGNQFFYDQTKVDEDLFLSTLVSNQQEVRLQKSEQSILIQKIANLLGTGDDNTSFKIAIDRINRRQLEEIGTSRSREKPINVVSKKIEELELERKSLEKYESLQYEVESRIFDVQNNIKKIENDMQMYTEIRNVLENANIKQQDVNLQKQIKSNNLNKIKEYDFNIDTIREENKELLEEFSTGKSDQLNTDKNYKFIVLSIILIFLNIMQFVFLKNNIVKYILFFIVVLFVIFFVFLDVNNRKKVKRKNVEYTNKIKNNAIINEKIKLIQNEIDNLEANNKEIDDKILNIQNEINAERDQKLKSVFQKYGSNIKFNETIKIEQVQSKIQKLQTELTNAKITLHSLILDKNNIEPKLDKLVSIQEDYVLQCKNKYELEKLNMSFELAKSILSECYELMKGSVAPRFTQNLSKNISEITNGKYTNVNFNDEIGLIVENEQGQYVPAGKLSVGTIEQLYLSLRLSMINKLSSESLPIILDEAFAYFDDERLENFLVSMSKNNENSQILIFTCTNREEKILQKNAIDYNLTNIS